MPILFEINNKGAVDLTKNWSVVGETMHIDVKQYFLWKLKEEGLLQIKHVLGDQKDANHFTNNFPGPTFEKHVQMYCGTNEYGKQGEVLKAMKDLRGCQ